MFRQGWKTVETYVPVDLRLLFYGAAVGVIYAAIFLLTGEPVDEATALGVAFFFETTVGLWLGVKAYFVVLDAIRKWLGSMERRLEEVGSQIGLVDVGPDDQESNPGRTPTRLTIRVARLFVPLTLVGTALSAGGAIAAILDSQVNIHAVDSYKISLAIGLPIAFLSIAVQCGVVWNIGRRITRLERKLDLVLSIHGITSNTKLFEQGIIRANAWVYRLTGERMAT